jgi:hypothetical protein
MKRTDLEKMKAVNLRDRMKQATTPGRFGGEAAEAVSRREQRERERALGLVPFAVKLEGDLVKRVQELAQSRNVPVNDLVTELLKKALGEEKS